MLLCFAAISHCSQKTTLLLTLLPKRTTNRRMGRTLRSWARRRKKDLQPTTASAKLLQRFPSSKASKRLPVTHSLRRKTKRLIHPDRTRTASKEHKQAKVSCWDTAAPLESKKARQCPWPTYRTQAKLHPMIRVIQKLLILGRSHLLNKLWPHTATTLFLGHRMIVSPPKTR